MNEIPPYLKLHVEEASDERHPPPESLASLCARFEDATGWPILAADESLDLSLGSLPKHQDAIDFESADHLAAAISDVMSEFQHTRSALRIREAELGAGIPVVRRDDEDHHLAVRLESAIRGGVEALGCAAGALYLLDDSTSELKLRSSFGLPDDRYLEPARTLRGSYADLEALVGHAVVLEDTQIVPHWKVPEDYPAAICVPVSSPTTPLGTLWIFSARKRDFSTRETDVIEIVAGRLACDLEREVLLQAATRATTAEHNVQAAGLWHDNQLPRVAPLLDDWQIAGWSNRIHDVGGAFYDWAITPRGTLTVAVGRAEGRPIEAALSSAMVLGALRSYERLDCKPRQVLRELNEQLWSSSATGHAASLALAELNVETGRTELALSAGAGGLVFSPDHVRQLEPNRMRLGTADDASFSGRRATLQAGDLLILMAGRLPTEAERLDLVDKTAEQILDEIRARMLAESGDEDRAVVVVRHRPS